MWTQIAAATAQSLAHTPESDISYLKYIIEANHFTKISEGPVNIKMGQFLRHGRDIGTDTQMLRPPYYDHGHFFKAKSGKIYCIYCPYQLNKIDIVNWVHEQNLIVQFFSRSWYSNDAVMVVISVEDDFIS